LTLTSFSDGQSWTLKQPELIGKLVELASALAEKLNKPQSRFEIIMLLIGGNGIL